MEDIKEHRNRSGKQEKIQRIETEERETDTAQDRRRRERKVI